MKKWETKHVDEAVNWKAEASDTSLVQQPPNAGCQADTRWAYRLGRHFKEAARDSRKSGHWGQITSRSKSISWRTENEP